MSSCKKFFEKCVSEGVLSAAARKLQDFLSFKKSVPKEIQLFKKFFILIFIFSILLGAMQSFAQSNSIQIDLGVEGCNNNGICEPGIGETLINCPIDCAVVTPPSG